MPWKETEMMHQRLLFTADYDKQIYSMTELCERYGISRKTGYKWLSRYQQQGPSGLLNQSKAANSCPHRTPEELTQRLLELKQQHPKWGAKKLLAVLKKREPFVRWPAVGTVQDLLQRNGLTQQHIKRRKTNHP